MSLRESLIKMLGGYVESEIATIVSKVPRDIERTEVNQKLIVTNANDEEQKELMARYFKENVSLIPYQASEYELLNKGFHLVSSHAGPLFSHLPSILGTAITSNSYQIRFPAGTSLNDLLRLNRNNELTTVIKGANNKFSGSASLISNAPTAAVLGVFTILSVVTSQYFLTEINRNMETIKKRVESIDFFLKEEKRSDLYANIAFINEVQRDLEQIICDAGYKQAVLSNIISIKKNADADIMFYTNYIKFLFSVISGDFSSKNEIQEILTSICEDIENLKYATMLYMYSSIMQIVYSDNMGNSAYIDTLAKDMKEKSQMFDTTLSDSFRAYNEEVNKMKNRIFLGSEMRKGKFDPNNFFNPLTIDEDKKIFCQNYLDTVSKIQLMCRNNATYVVCNDKVYIGT